MKPFRRASVGVVAAVLLGIGGVAASAGAASAATLGSCTASGVAGLCSIDGTATKPVLVTVTLTGTSGAAVSIMWSTDCSNGVDTAVYNAGQVNAKIPATVDIPLPYHQPASCDVAPDIGLGGGGGTVHATLSSYSTLPPPPATAIKGYDGKCADDAGNSSAKGAKVELWSCTKGAAQNWTFSGGYLKHGSMCANDSGDGGNGAKVILYTCTRAQNDLWTRNSRSEYVLRAHNSALCLTDPRDSRTNGVQLTVETCKNTANQHWSLP